MKVAGINNNISHSMTTLKAVGLGALFALSPLVSNNQPVDKFEYANSVSVPKPSEIIADNLAGLDIIEETNFRGGVTKMYDKASVERLKNRIVRSEVKYSTPIELNKDLYLNPFGMFKAKRPGGRPHMGLDIFVAKYGRKPKSAVKVLAPVEGVVIACKKANEKDNVVANSVTILGIDGKKYGFDHLARKSDFDAKDAVELPQVGQIVKNGDVLGNVGSTGETDMWHLHLVVMTEDALKEQLTDPKWLDVSKKSQYTTLKGQVNPLDENITGELGAILNSIPVK